MPPGKEGAIIAPNLQKRTGGTGMRVLFKNGTVVSGKGTRRADVLVDGEKIRRVAREIHVDDAQIVDAAGMLLMPGFIDAHTHFDLDVCNTTTADDFASGSRAALRGGTTTIVDFACPNKGETLHDGLRLWHEKADGKCACDYGFHMTIDDWNDTIESEIDDMYAEGISSFKMYMTYPAMMIGDKLMYKALKKLKEKGGICGVHCENAGVIDALIEEKKAAGEQGSVGSHPRTRPDFLEAEAVGRLLHIAEAVDIPVVIVHTTNAAALREIEAARRRGQKVYVETCPQYLVLDDSVYDNEDWLQAAKYVCAPPIRKAADRRALWQAIRRGEVQTVSTDHCSFTTAQKLAGREDFTTIPGGLPGVETRGELVYTFGVTTRKISLAAMCRVLAENPAKLYGMFPRKGIIAEGADADIVVYDPAADHVIRAEDMVGAADYNPYEGVVTRGSVSRCGCGASWRSTRAVCWQGRRANTSGAASAACEREEIDNAGQDLGIYSVLPVAWTVSGGGGVGPRLLRRAEEAPVQGDLEAAAGHRMRRRRRGAVLHGDVRRVFHHSGLLPHPARRLGRLRDRGVPDAAGAGAGVFRCGGCTAGGEGRQPGGEPAVGGGGRCRRSCCWASYAP